MQTASQILNSLKLMGEEEGGERVGEKDALRGLRERLERAGAGRGGSLEALAIAIGDAVDEAALIERTLAEERKTELAETLGTSAVEKEEELATATVGGLWGRNEPWTVRPE